MIKKVIIIAVIAIVAVTMLLSLFSEDIYYNSVDNNHWKQLKSIIKDDKVSKIILESGSPIELIDSEKSNFVSSLNKSKFYKSNWRKEGPTGAIITIIFKSGSKQNFEYWGDAKFETTYNSGQFVIKSVEIEQVLKKHNITLNLSMYLT